ncbi:MAG: formylglycine-generating enzyme family protein, partial [Cyanobacteria bacterium J06641_2]
IWELKRLLENYGVFRDVRAWGLVTDENGQIYIRPGIGKNAFQQRLASHREILDPNRRRLILLVSDCVAAIWRNGVITQVLKDWTNTQPVAIIQMLPDWLWLKTGLGLGASVNLGSLTPGVANKHLLVKKQLLWKDINLDTGIKIPVLTLEPDKALPWSQMLAGKSDALASGFVLSSAISLQTKPSPSRQQSQTTTPQKVNASERVYRFRMTASPMGRKLAGLLAAAPVINLPVVRLIQENLLPASRQVHVAEVFLGGLLKPLTPIEADTLPDTVQYDFMDDEIRGILLEAAPVKDSADIFDAVSRYVAAELGKSLQDFVALLKAPEEAENEQVKPFAEVAVKILKRLGGDYAAFAEQLEEKSQIVTESSEVSEKFPGIPSLKTFDFKIATVFIEEAPKAPADISLQPFNYEVATVEIQQKRAGLSKRKTEVLTINRRQENQYFVEDLGEGIRLELVLIPDGTFMMGAPNNEEGSSSYERPQHQVTVPSFFMGKYQVTQAQWKAIARLPQVEKELQEDPSRFKGDNRPVEQVSWYDAVEFCTRLSFHTGREYRLPSEAEWEYACCASTNIPFHFGQTITSELANYNANYTYGRGSKGTYRKQTTPVGSFEVANAFGLYDMHGNVWEWCLDDWHDNYENAPTDGSAWFDNDNDNLYQKQNEAVLRGGSWYNEPENCRSACRIAYVRRDSIFGKFGFRVVYVSRRT